MRVVIKTSNLHTLLFFPPIPEALSLIIQVRLYSLPSQQQLITLLHCMSLAVFPTISNFSTLFKLSNHHTPLCSKQETSHHSSQKKMTLSYRNLLNSPIPNLQTFLMHIHLVHLLYLPSCSSSHLRPIPTSLF